MKTLATALLLSTLPCSAWACTGTVLIDATNDSGDATTRITKGQHLTGLDHLLRNPKTGEILACAGDRCYPAMAKDEDHNLTEIVRLDGCRIADASAVHGDLEWHDLENTSVAETTPPEKEAPEAAPKTEENGDVAVERKKMLAAAIVMQSLSQTGTANIIVDDAGHAHLKENSNAKIVKTAECRYSAVYPMQGGKPWRFTLDFPKLTALGRRLNPGSNSRREVRPIAGTSAPDRCNAGTALRSSCTATTPSRSFMTSITCSPMVATRACADRTRIEA